MPLLKISETAGSAAGFTESMKRTTGVLYLGEREQNAKIVALVGNGVSL